MRILPYKGNRGYHYYLDGLKVNGKRKRLFFTSEAEAKEELKKWEVPGHVQVELPFGDLARIEIGRASCRERV